LVLETVKASPVVISPPPGGAAFDDQSFAVDSLAKDGARTIYPVPGTDITISIGTVTITGITSPAPAAPEPSSLALAAFSLRRRLA
jgi:hypothetical protein